MNRLLAEFCAGADQPLPAVDVVNADDVLPSRLATTELAVGAVSAAVSAAAELAHARGARPRRVRVDGRRVSAAFRSDRLLRVDGQPVEGFAELSGFWRTSDGWVRTHANYPHHRQRLLATVGLPTTATASDLREVLLASAAAEVEQAVVDAGGICAAVRSAEAWHAHPQATAVARLPLVSWRRWADAPPRALDRIADAPLLPAAGLRVLDLTRVIAGPVATRTLALFGADVLRIDPPRLPEIPFQHLDTGMGKRSALLDVTVDTKVFEQLLAVADVVVVGYRPDVAERLHLSPPELAARRPGVVLATLDAWGGVGPWGRRRGFDSIVQAASGIAVEESVDGDVPGALPAQALDHATGYLLAAAILTALVRQQHEGGTVHVAAHLARTAQWLLEHRDDTPRSLPDVSDLLREYDSPSGRMLCPPPATELAGTPDEWPTVGSPWGADEPVW